MTNLKMLKRKTGKHIILMAVMVFALLGVLVGCKKENVDSTVNDVESTEASTEEITEASTEASTSESEAEATEEIEVDDEKEAKPTQTTEASEKPDATTKPDVTTKPNEETTHTHSWSSATCTSPKTCQCGETSGSKLGHDFGSNNKTCSRCGASNPNYTEHSTSQETTSTCSHAYGYGEINCMLCGEPHTHDWKIVVQTNTGVEVTPDEDFCCHSGWYFDTYEELRAHMDIPNVHGMVYLNDGSNGVTSVSPDYTGAVDFYACCHGWANCAGDGEGERIEYEITQEVQFCKLCGVRGEATDIGERVIISHTYDD